MIQPGQCRGNGIWGWGAETVKTEMTVRHREVMELGQTTKQRASLSCQPTQEKELGIYFAFPTSWQASICQVTLKVVFYAQHLSVPTLGWAQSTCCWGGPGTRGTRRGDPTCSWLCLPPQHNASHPACTASSLASDRWLLAICHITQNQRYHKIAWGPSLAYFGQIQELRKVLLKAFHTTFSFFLISSFCVKVTVVLHIYLMVCLTSHIHTCTVFAHIQTHPNGSEGVIFRPEFQNFVLQQKKKSFYQRKTCHSTCFLDELQRPSIFGLSYTWVHTNCRKVLSLNLLFWNTCSRALVLKEEELSEKIGRNTHFCSDDSGHQLFPQQPDGSVRFWVSPWKTVQPHTKHLPCQISEQSLDPQQLNIQLQEELHSFSKAFPVLFFLPK